jgi:DnaJ-class molecular chaperone
MCDIYFDENDDSITLNTMDALSREAELCDRCSGTGTITVLDDDGEYPYEFDAVCPVCYGEGYI